MWISSTAWKGNTTLTNSSGSNVWRFWFFCRELREIRDESGVVGFLRDFVFFCGPVMSNIGPFPKPARTLAIELFAPITDYHPLAPDKDYIIRAGKISQHPSGRATILCPNRSSMRRGGELCGGSPSRLLCKRSGADEDLRLAKQTSRYGEPLLKGKQKRTNPDARRWCES